MVFAQQSWAKEKIVLGTFLIPKYVQSKSRGEFIELTRALSKKVGIDVQFIIFPPKRTIREFNFNKLDGYFPAVESNSSKKIEKTSDFYIKEDFIFERFEDGYKKLKNKKPKLCLTAGYPYTENVLNNPKWDVFYATSDETCIELLLRKRADLFIGEEITGLAAIKNLRVKGKVVYDRYSPISTQNVFYAFQNSKKGKELSEKFDKALKEMMIEGTYDKIFHLKTKK